MIDAFREILETIRKNKMRTFLTGFAVAWGVFMLIVLLASGNGLRNGVTSNFSSRASNSVTIWSGRTSVPYGGFPENRRIRFYEKDYNMIRQIPEAEYVSTNMERNGTLSYDKEYGAWALVGVYPDAAEILNIKVNSGNGRFLNLLDIRGRRKSIVINPEIRKVLFKEDDPLGKYVVADGVAFQVVGIYDAEDQHRDTPPAYIPFTTAQMIYGRERGFSQIDFTVKGLTTLEANEAFVERLRGKMGRLHRFDPTDRSAIYIQNTAEDSIQAQKIFGIIGLFILIVGVASLMAGIVGVGNIMLVTVRERTREIGIRKAIGAKPVSILGLIILEAIFITTLAGYVGIVLGVGLTELVSSGIASSPGEHRVFLDPTVDLGTVIGATAFLIFCGVLAGLVPAVKAASVSPIEAMRAE